MAKKQANGRRQANREERRRRLKHEIRSGLRQAWQQSQQGCWQQAAEFLEQLDRRVPGQPEILERLAEVYPHLGRLDKAQAVAARLLELNHESADLTLLMAGACLTNLRLATGLAYFERFVDRWPSDPRVDHVRETMSTLGTEISNSAAKADVPAEDARQLAVDHEAVLDALASHKLVEAEDLARRLHERYPAFAPAGNNLADALFFQDRFDESLAVARQVLEQNPTNGYTLATLVSRLCVIGRCEEARGYTERLRAAGPKSTDTLFKQMEAFSYLGDDEALLDTWAEVENVAEQADRRALAFGHHLAAVALMRRGQDPAARMHWYKSLDLDPKLKVARENLEDSEKPAGEREGPWPLEAWRWLSRRALEEYQERMQWSDDATDEEQVDRKRRYLADHPEIEAVIPLLLDRGEPTTRALFLSVAMTADTPALRQALKNFALGKRGSDAQRVRAAEHLGCAGELDAQRVRMWVKGESREVVLQQFELHGQGTSLGDPQADKLACEAYLALQKGDGRRAEERLKRAIELVPDRPSLHNNLANAYRAQDREDEALELTKWIRRRFPEYFFGRVHAAHQYISTGDLDLAEAEMAPIRERRRLHFSEFSARMLAEILLSNARRNSAAARAWFDFWARTTPDDPQLEVARDMLEGGRVGWFN